MPDDPPDPAELLCALDATEAAGVPPHLVEYLRMLVRSTRWVSLSERMPDNDDAVLALIDGGKDCLTSDRGGIEWFNRFNSRTGREKVTHWMSIPELPQTSEDVR